MKYRYNNRYRPRQTAYIKKAVRLQSRVNTRSAKRRFSALKKTGGGAVLLIIIIVALVFSAKWIKKNFVEAERFKIKKITAAGFINVSENEFLEKLPVAYGDNIILSYAVGIGRRMKKQCPGIKTIKVARNIAGEINIQVTERKPIAWRRSETGAPEGVDCENVCFRLKPGDYPVPELSVDPGNGKIRARAVAYFNELIEKKEKLYWDMMKLYNVGEEFFIVLKDSSKIHWGRYDGEDIGPKISQVYNVIKDAKTRYGGFEYIELQVLDEGRVPIMPKPAAKNTAIHGRIRK